VTVASNPQGAWRGQTLQAVIGLALLVVTGIGLAHPVALRRGWLRVTDYRAVAPDVVVPRDLSSSAAVHLQGLLDAARQRAEAWWGRLEARPTVWYADTTERKRALGFPNPYVSVPPEDRGGVLFVGPKGGEVDLLAHGLGHAEMLARFGALWRRLPAWFDEGVAAQVDHRPFLVAAPPPSRPPRVEDLRALATRAAFRGPEGEAALTEARAAVSAWLAAAGGPAAVERLRRAMEDGASFEAAWNGLASAADARR